MTAAIESGLPKLKIEEVAAQKQARIDSGQDLIIGVNAFRREEETEIDIREVDNSEVRNQQLLGLERLEIEADEEKVQFHPNALSHLAETGTGNLLEEAVNAARGKGKPGRDQRCA